MYNPTSLAVRSATHFTTLVASVITRLHRKYDARFQLLDEAFVAAEKRDPTLYPTIRKVAITQASGGASPTVSLANGDLTVTVTGVNFTTDESVISATLGSAAMSVTAGATTTSIVLTLASGSLAGVAAAEQHALLALRVNGVLCSPISLEFVL
jgi:hypothetical protein